MRDSPVWAERYEQQGLIGEGGIGRVYAGLDRQTGGRVAIKLLRPEILASDPEMVERFRREGDLLQRLNHPNIIRVIETLEGDQPAIIMAYVDGGSLADRLDRHGPLPLDEALAVALEVADALARAHHLGVIHRDVKPANILLDAAAPVLTDFGLAHVNTWPSLTGRGEVLGTMPYLSPEGCNRQRLDARADTWALGVVIYEMISGKKPFTGDNPGALIRAILSETPPALSTRAPEVPAALDALVAGMLTKVPGMRVGSMRQVAAELEAIAHNQGPDAPGIESSIPGWTSVSGVTSGLLHSKLAIPEPRPASIQRARLLARLEDGIRTGHALTLVSGPAGFGKTTLISEWARGHAGRAAWLSLDEADNDPTRFLHYLVTACRTVNTAAGGSINHLIGVPGVPGDALLPGLLNTLPDGAGPLLIVLDDYHLITAPAIHGMLNFILEHRPPDVYLVIASREDPPLPLARLRARGQITEVRERDLRFTPDEASAFLTGTMGIVLEDDSITALAGRTEGWPAGLQLAALALKERGSDPGLFISAFAGSDRYVMDYLLTEVLHKLPAATRDFMGQTAILARLCGPLCDAVTGRTDSQGLLEEIDRANLFLTPLDHERRWYRYHALFAEVLRVALPVADTLPLHQRAAKWHHAEGDTDEAFYHATQAATLGDPSTLITLLEEDADALLAGGELPTLARWLDAVPPDALDASPELMLINGWMLAFSGIMMPAEEIASAIDEETLNPEQLGRLLLLRAYIGMFLYNDAGHMVPHVEAALDQPLPPHWRVIALWALAEAQERTRPIEEAITSLHTARRQGRGLRLPLSSVVLDNGLITALHSAGRLSEADRTIEEALRTYRNPDGGYTPVAGLLLTRRALILRDRGQLDAARALHEQSMALAKALNIPSSNAFLYGSAAVTYARRGDEDARTMMEHAQRAGSPAEASWLAACEAQVASYVGDLPAAQRWAKSAGLGTGPADMYLDIEGHVLAARLALADPACAQPGADLDTLLAFCMERGLERWRLPLLLVKAAALADSAPVEAQALTREAVLLAAPEGVTAPFMEAEPIIRKLLPSAWEAAPAFVETLLADLGVEGDAWQQAVQPLADPLTERELEVLQLISEGLSNANIADTLVITVGTVKRHINNIYSKLDVGSRTQALARARELGLDRLLG